MRALALVAAVAAAVVIPGAPSGVGVTLVAVLVAATALTAARRTRDLAVFGAFALTLVSFPTLLDAQWVVKVDVLAAWVCATFAVGGPRLISAIAPVIAVPAIPALLPRPSSRAVPAFRAAAIALVVAVPFAALFLTADAAFAAIADNTPRPMIGSAPGRIVAFCVVLLAALALALAAKKELKAPAGLRPWRLSVVEWAVPLVVLNALFLAFVTVQVAVLFGGNDHVVRTAGLTYAEYARQGFWQLIAAAALTLVVVKGATLSAFPRSRSERLLLKALLGFLCALTIVIVASALHRLRLYEDAYGLTRPRFAAEAFALWLGGTFLLVVLLGAAGRARELPWLGSAWAAIALVGFSFANPDARIAQRNIDRWRETGRIDIGYLSTLSADAAPALGRLPTQLRRQALREISRRLADDEPWTSANLSRARARRQLANAVAEGG